MVAFAIQTGKQVLTTQIQAGFNRLLTHVFADDIEGARLEQLEIQTSSEGAVIPRVYGRMRLAGQVIWAGRFRESEETESLSGKGGPEITEYRYSVSLAVGLCEGEIARIGRIWANGAELDLSSVTVRLHGGSETQQPDGLIAAIEGPEAPAYRGCPDP